MLILKMVFRNILRQKRRSLLTCFMSVAGFILLSICMGLADGGYQGIIDLIIQDETGHVQIHKKGYLDRPSLYNTINEPDLLINKLNSFAFVSASAPRVYSAVLAFAGKKTVGIRITGINPKMEGQATGIEMKVAKGRFLSDTAKNEVLISNSIAKVLNIGTGDEIILIGQAADGSIANDKFDVAGIKSGKDAGFGAMNCYMHIKTAQEFLFLSHRIHEIAIILQKHAKPVKTAEKLTNELDDKSLDVEPWQEVKKEFYQAMQTDLTGQRISFVILMIVVGIGVLDTVIMTILERTPEFGLLKAMGTRPKDLIKLIVGETAALSFIGIFCGFIIAFAINLYLSKNGIYFSEPLYFGGVYMEKMESTVSFHVFWIPALLTFLTSMAACIVPACRAAYISPVKAIRL